MTSRVRCAVYTRKSSDEGLDQSFNTLDAQREACEAFILSQKHEGWTLIATKYDDGGFSGGNMERPGLQALMADIGEGKINTVVVYKVDRLTRSLADFAKLVEQFDSKGVNFVSVTQQFNTTTSMGRLTLNVLLSFAQFEREVTGERIRDKIAASKARGMWMGGPVPLGYDVSNRRLHINSSEAKTVQEIFRQYLRLRAVSALMAHLESSGIRSKVRISASARKTGGGTFSRGALYQLLRNHIYVGEIEHKGSIYPGEHDGIIDRELWDQVQALLDENRQGKSERSRTASGSLLTGLLFTESGIRYIPTNTQKGNRRYHYYTSQALIKGDKNNRSIGRLPAPAVERAITDRIQAFMTSTAELHDAVKQSDNPEINLDRILKHAKQKSAEGSKINRTEMSDAIRTFTHRVIVCDSKLELQLNLDLLVRWLQGSPVQPGSVDGKVQIFSLSTPFCHVAQGNALKLVIGNVRHESTESREAIAKAIARARSWCGRIVDGKVAGLADLARREGLAHCYVKRIFPLAFLGPEAIEYLLNDHDGRSRTLDSLMCRLPMRWNEQRVFLHAQRS